MHISTGKSRILRHQRAYFGIRDIHHRELTRVWLDLLATVVDLSDRGLGKDAFVMAEGAGIATPMIVPTERILESL
jgi:hypothetical protein